jgi:hypothetical protein
MAEMVRIESGSPPRELGVSIGEEGDAFLVGERLPGPRRDATASESNWRLPVEAALNRMVSARSILKLLYMFFFSFENDLVPIGVLFLSLLPF